MNGTMQMAVAKAAARINKVAGETVLYCSGGKQTGVRMRPADTEYVSKTGKVVTDQWHGTDWIATPEAWSKAGQQYPLRGDTILRPTANGIETYQLVAPPGKQLFDYATYGECILIHSQLVPTT